MEKRFVFAIIAFLGGGLGLQEFLIGNDARGALGIIFCWTGIPAVIAVVQAVRALCSGSDEEFLRIYPHCRL